VRELSAPELPPCKGFEAIAGRGVQGRWGPGGAESALRAWFEELGLPNDGPRPNSPSAWKTAARSTAAVVVTADWRPVFGDRDALKPGSTEGGAGAQRLGLEVVMLPEMQGRSAEGSAHSWQSRG